MDDLFSNAPEEKAHATPNGKAHQISLNTTLGELMEMQSGKVKEGTRCACCGQYVKLYKRKINSSNALCLYEFYKISEKEGYKFYHITDLIEKSQKMRSKLNGGEFARMRHWGFIEEMPKDENDKYKKTSGYWRMTEHGKAFATNNLKVQKNILILNNKIIGFDGEEVTISQCFKDAFDYEELMGETVIEGRK